ncbi:cathepsin W [Hemicordylus capensis]|uniref:cathepsin W n=1 Tax=Hemicordylus capensis TaxID=884348 RepID=UPI00230383BB|nr:cathepsin W [Hemicordylus capensis]
MWPAALPASLLLWGLWITAFPVGSILPPDLSMSQKAQMFQDFVIRFNKTYRSPEETQHRFKIFLQNLERSQAQQASELGTAQYGITQFSDLTETEFKERCGNGHASPPDLTPSQRQPDAPLEGEISPSCDWRKTGAIPEVKHQGEKCASCWAFAAVANIEALWNIHRGSPRNLSAQEMLDCTYWECNKQGCQGGYPWDGFLTVVNRSGLSSEKLYPYTGKVQKCLKLRKRNLTPIDGYEMLPRDEKHIAERVASQGPVTVLLNCAALQNYQKGIIQRSAKDCDPKYLDHVGLIVGYGEAKSRRGSWNGQYWIIQNSWGKDWGEEGYFRFYRGSNTCGIAMYPATAIVKNNRGKKPVFCHL